MNESWPTFHDLVVAYKSCRLHKPSNRSQTLFEARLGENLSLLFKEIHSGRYRPSPATCFVVTHPKPREIFASEFRDRVVHHLVVSRLEPVWERKFIQSSFACRLGKGSHGAIRYAQQKVRKLSQGGNKTVWALQLDVAKFFVTINRTILCNLILKDCNHPKLRELIQVIYGHDARRGARLIGDSSQFKLIPAGKSWFDQLPEQGVPIGNLSSQLGANIYLTGLDHFILRVLKPGAYLRYMDDGLALNVDPEKLQSMVSPINEWLGTHRAQQLNPSKTHLTNLFQGIEYLGYRLKQVDSAQEPLQVFAEPIKKWRWVSALRQLERSPFLEFEKPHILAPFLPNKSLMNKISSINSQLGTFHHCRSYQLRKKSMTQFIQNTTTPKDIPTDFVDPWCPFQLKKGYRAIRLR